MPLIPFAVTGRGRGVAQTVEVDGGDYVIETDAYEAFGGQDAHPSPLSFALASLSSCNQVTSSISPFCQSKSNRTCRRRRHRSAS